MSEANNKKKPGPEASKLLKNVAFATLKDDKGKKELPALLDILLPIWREGVMTRQPARLTIQPDGGHWRATIDCPTEGVMATFLLDNLPDLLKAVDDLLASGKAQWAMSWIKRKKHLPTIDDIIQ